MHSLVDDSIAPTVPFAAIGVLDAHFEDGVPHARNLIAGCMALRQFIEQRLEVRFDLPILLGELAQIALKFRGEHHHDWW